jgi:DNA-binding SARP family transcriptional activator
VIRYRVLGEVAAWDDGWKAGLRRQQRLILACLVMEKGRTVSASTLEEAIRWDEKESRDQFPGRGLKAAVSDLRVALRPALPDAALQSVGDGAYRLVLNPEQADVLRFLDRLLDAGQARGDDRIRLLRAALAEWGPDARGLYGGQPLLDLPGTWAETQRYELRKKHRKAVLECVKHDLDSGFHREVMRECDQLTVAEALGDDDFVGVWMTATFLSGQRKSALDIFRRADEYAKNHSLKGASAELHGLVEMIRNDDPRLGIPDHLLPVLPTAVADVPNARADQAPAESVPGPASNDPVKSERTTVSEPGITFTISGNARVGSAIGQNEGDITVNMGAAADPAEAVDGAEPADTQPGEKSS